MDVRRWAVGVILCGISGAALASGPLSDKALQDTASATYRAYLAGGVDGMTAFEERCWKREGKGLNAFHACSPIAFAGTLIEHSIAQRKGRPPSMPYATVTAVRRMQQRSGIVGADYETHIRATADRATLVLEGLMMAGMQ